MESAHDETRIFEDSQDRPSQLELAEGEQMQREASLQIPPIQLEASQDEDKKQELSLKGPSQAKPFQDKQNTESFRQGSGQSQDCPELQIYLTGKKNTSCDINRCCTPKGIYQSDFADITLLTLIAHKCILLFVLSVSR